MFKPYNWKYLNSCRQCSFLTHIVVQQIAKKVVLCEAVDVVVGALSINIIINIMFIISSSSSSTIIVISTIISAELQRLGRDVVGGHDHLRRRRVSASADVSQDDYTW